MKPSKKAKLVGLSSLNEMSELTGKSVKSLILLNKNHPLEFNLILYGAVLKKCYEILNNNEERL